MSKPHIRVELVDGTTTWVTVMPIRQMDHLGVQLATGEAFAMFLSNLCRTTTGEEKLDQHLRSLGD